MIEHVKIFGFIVILMTGVVAIAYLSHINKQYPHKSLSYLTKFTFVSNLAFAIMFLYHYFAANLPASEFNPSNIFFQQITTFITTSIGILSAYYILALLLTLRGITIHKKYRYTIFVIILIFGLLYSLPLFEIEVEWISSFLDFVATYVFKNFVSLEIVFLLLFIFFWKRSTEINVKKLSIFFSLIYLLGYLITFLIFLIAQIIPFDTPVRLFLGLFTLCYFNIAPIIWTRYVYLPFATRLGKIIAGKTDLKALFEANHITGREAEIIKLIIEGKNNSEIQEKLFISFHTVKNHLSNIYRKLNVKSRYELVHFFVKKMQ